MLKPKASRAFGLVELKAALILAVRLCRFLCRQLAQACCKLRVIKMATQLLKIPLGKRDIRLYWSDDWASKTPWRHNNLVQPYVAHCRDLEDDGRICMDFFYLGPFGLIYARWIG